MRSILRQCTVLFALVPSFAMASRHHADATLRAEFVRAMNEATHRQEESKRQTALVTRLLRSAKLVKTAFTNKQPTTTTPGDDQDERKLNYGYNWNYNYGYYNYQNQYSNNNYQDNGEENQEEGEEAADDAWAQYGGLNLTNYALKYLGCQNIHTWSDEMAMDRDATGVLLLDRFVVFRLCPKAACSNYNAMGCDYNYGEYTIPMEDYLATMQTYHIEQYQTYCQTCASCMTGTGNFAYDYWEQNNRDLSNGGGGQYYYYGKNGYYYSKNYGGGYGNNANNDDNKADDGGNYNAGDDGKDDDGGGGGDDGSAVASNETAASKCVYADVCASYQEACGPEMYNDDNYMTYAQNYAEYFECSEFNVGGAVSYLGPHCRSDGFTIGIGIYEDEYCSSYVGDVVDLEQVTGQAYKDDYLSPYYPKNCISCTARESYDLLTDDDIKNEENGGLYEVCGYLYEQAAKCNRYLGEDGFQGQYEQEANEEDVCNFVASLVENNYDEYGEAVLEDPEWTLARWKEINAYRQDLVRTTPGQILGIVLSIFLCLALSAYITFLRYKLTRRLPWSLGFGRNDAAEQAGRIGRVSSGITMQRSLSGLEPEKQNGSFI